MPTPSVCIPSVNVVNWVVIPKGLTDGKFRFTVMATFDQSQFLAHGPFASDGTCNGNWCAWIRDSLKGFMLYSSAGGKTEVAVKPIPKVAEEIWTRTFPFVTKQLGPSNELAAVPARATQLIRDCTSVAAQTAEKIAMFSVALTLSSPGPKVAPGWIEVPTIGHLFPDGPSPAGALGLTSLQLNQIQRDYAELADTFLPVSPSLGEQNAARLAREDRQHVAATDPGAQLLQHMEKVYSPQLGAGTSGKSSHEAQPIFSARVAERFAEAFNELKPTGTPDLTAFSAVQQDSWAMAALKHMVSTVPYVPTSAQEITKASAEYSGQNRLGALMAESGLLGSLGLLFDFEVQAAIVDSELWAEPVWKAGKSPCFVSQSPRTATTSQGGAKLRGDISAFAAEGFLKLGLGAGSAAPQFMLSDFRFDEAFRQAQLRAQTERNLQPQHSPGANLELLPTIQLVDFQSHDLSLHWVQRPDLAQKRRSPHLPAATPVLYFEDLVTGIRPMLGRVDQGDRITWFDLTRKEVVYGALKEATRSKADIERDGGVVPLISFDRRTVAAR